jgi:hypothetical protein
MELLLVSGAGRRAIARKFNVSADAVWRHGKSHISDEQRSQLLAGPVKLRELADRAGEEGLSLLEYIAMVRSTVLKQFFAAGEANDRQGVALLTGRLTELFRLEGQVNGDISRIVAPITNNIAILSSPIMGDLKVMLIQRLGPFPEALKAVVDGLDELSSRASQGAITISRPALEHASL